MPKKSTGFVLCRRADRHRQVASLSTPMKRESSLDSARDGELVGPWSVSHENPPSVSKEGGTTNEAGALFEHIALAFSSRL